jgi:hypothetical protein
VRRAEINLNIGVDFDNTIADYDLVFEEVAVDMGFLAGRKFLSKADVKNAIISQNDGDISWQRLQGQIYGKYMHKAKVFPGFIEFLLLAKIKGFTISVVSHKSEFGHFDDNKISLRSEALKWIINNKLIEIDLFKLQEKDIYFEATREEKIQRIITLGCNFFVDDLEEVFYEKFFPVDINKFLFDPLNKKINSETFVTINSWRSLTKLILGEWSIEDVHKAFKITFPNLNLINLELIKGRGNSRIYKLNFLNSQYGVLKIYPDRQLDRRKRIETEFIAIDLLGKAGLSVPKALAMDTDTNWAVYSWIEGSPRDCDDTFIEDAANFIQKLNLLSKENVNLQNVSQASEACLSGVELERQINNRFKLLKSISDEKLHLFLDKVFYPVYINNLKLAKSIMGSEYGSSIPLILQIISPSDFGSHNAIKDLSGKTIFIDFEYFGWDDPVKLISDFYWHPAMNLTDKQQNLWLNRMKNIFTNDIDFDKRLTAYLTIFGLRWCLILLNEFIPNRMNQRIHADNNKSSEVNEIKLKQLEKSSTLINKIININTKNYGSTLQTS